ncbi:MAG: hypothetical protein HY238_12095 [Acidobacteria bacterium]|nr:hypothetical protein [Acidobacteriota bacterium]
MLAQTAPEVSGDIHHDVSPPLREIAPLPPKADGHRERPLLLTHPGRPVTNQQDPVVQTSAGPLVATTPGLSIAGVGNGDYGFKPDAAPPDTNGAVGATQFVQWVNESFAVFEKSTGAKLYGPAAGNTLWSGFGGGCQTNNDGDPIAQYDKINNRWIMTQFSVSTTPYLQCVAVSQTSDATGAWNRYSFAQPNFNDYPKVGVWPDAYYLSFNMFSAFFVGPRACAFDGAKMRAGLAATQVCFQLGNSFGSLLPSDLDGSTLPPAGSPNFFLSFGTNSLNLWKFHVNFTTPSSSSFTGPTNLPVAAFNTACNGGSCIPQLGTSQKLDSLGDRLMYRLAYRHFADGHESLAVNHSVNTGSGNVGVRWYELRNPTGSTMAAGTPVVYQQGTFAPDSNYRWMGSIAMDQAGNMAVGYSVSSGSMNPAIRFTGRVPADPLGTMQAENVIINGTGSQTSGLSRWGDYSSMGVDPVDDCTLWYTTEYLKSSGSFNWSTWIYAFKFPGCGGPATPDFSISASPSSQSVVQGNSTSYTVTVTALNGFSNNVSLSVSGVPSGASAGFSPNPILGGSGSSTLSVNTGTAATGTYTLTITGTDGILSHTATVTLIITAPSAGDFSISASPATVVVRKGGTAKYTVTVTPSGGFSSDVTLTVGGVPSGASAGFSPNPITGGSGSSTLSVSTGSAALATYPLTITGTGGGKTHSTTVNLKIH